ncbi:uncharacterized protein C3orf14 homolog isoform X1 [Pseudonaja textilis]|uniref:uncharacterized protein C3orf14 homolog isoform X1 n=1 Tax=Pseudonaja textilis TaxID=8673 RepID=UPI000EA8826B|nr:uncharacterized protein C3orf14 homolog isoform X1 [Pseudonaja textilis]
MASYLAQEIQLAKQHEEILSRRLVLLQQMESHLRDKDAEQAWHTQEADAAHKRNVSLLNLLKRKMNCGCHFCKRPSFQKILCMLQDIEAAAKNLQFREHLLLHPEIVNLETLYWAKVEESIPKWEPFFLGRTQAPIGLKKKSHQQYSTYDQH